ncbi:MAG: D-alanine aminotransferase [uncultured Gemmatimonadetes bacterium]|uniref:D-alanine aminotransferase n=1 Tax=uncultured Gemmatimonadota bacterium TaxID=203437 RepID=A0A6J4KB61_9BACT|nr:MAG: D-alanine aminotransferase [uncultured Gemmatimonadota bacterium]
MEPIVYLNGGFVPHREARISADDRGFLFGDGVYEVIRAVDGALFEAGAHARRMAAGLQALRIGSLEGGAHALLGVAERLLRENALLEGEATVYLQVTRGAAPRRHTFPAPSTPPTVYVSATRFQPPAELQEHGAAAITQADVRWGRCNVKSTNLLPNILAKQLAAEAGAFEAILVRDGVVTEGASTSVFGVSRGELRTHPLTPHILPGITRAVVLELAAARGLRVDETPLRGAELGRLDEIFLVGTTTDLMPVVVLDGTPVGGGSPGPVTRALQQGYRARFHGAARSLLLST